MLCAAVVAGASGFGVAGGLELQPVRPTIKTTTANEMQRVHRHDEDMGLFFRAWKRSTRIPIF